MKIRKSELKEIIREVLSERKEGPRLGQGGGINVSRLMKRTPSQQKGEKHKEAVEKIVRQAGGGHFDWQGKDIDKIVADTDADEVIKAAKKLKGKVAAKKFATNNF